MIFLLVNSDGFVGMIMTTHAASKLVSLFFISLCAACGGGGGGGGGSSSSICTTIACTESGELSANAGVSMVNAPALNNAGYTGSGVTVGVVDSGIYQSHVEFDGKTLSGIDYFGDDTPLVDTSGHGTHVAAIIAGEKDNFGMRGVAYDANLRSYRAIGGSTSLGFDALLANIFDDHATNNVRVSNNSWGSSPTTLESQVNEAFLRASYANAIDAMDSAQSNGTVIVFANGNNGLGSQGAPTVDMWGGLPVHINELSDAWLTVAAVDLNGVETLYTNRCGNAADFCVTAPGGGDSQSSEGIYSAYVDSSTDYDRISGTSMAAPHVSGIAALLTQKFPSLTSAQIATRIKDTASLASLTGYNGCTLAICTEAQMRSIFGHGLVNANAAASLLGNAMFVTSDGKSVDISNSKLNVPPVLMGAKSQLLNTHLLVRDSFDGATFTYAAADVFDTSQNAEPSYVGYVQPAGVSSAALGSKASLTSDSVRTAGFGESFHINANDSYAGQSYVSWGRKASFLPKPEFFGDAKVDHFEQRFALTDQTAVGFYTQTDMTGFTGMGVNVSSNISDKTAVHASFSSASNNVSTDYTNASQAELVSTNSMDFGVEHQVSPTVNVFGRGRLASMDDTDQTSTNVALKNAVMAQGNVGVEWSNQGNSISVGLYNPATFVSGTGSMNLPTSISEDGQVSYENKKFNLSGDELNVGMFVAARVSVSSGDKNLGELGFAAQQSPYDPNELERLSLTYRLAF